MRFDSVVATRCAGCRTFTRASTMIDDESTDDTRRIRAAARGAEPSEIGRCGRRSFRPSRRRANTATCEENAEYHAAKEQQSFAEGRIKEIESKLADAQIIDVTKIKHDRQGGLRLDGDAGRGRDCSREALQDRRRRRGGSEAEQDLGDVADGARVGREIRRRFGDRRTRRTARSNTRSTRSNTIAARAAAG